MTLREAQMTKLLRRAQAEGLIARRHHSNPRLMLVSSSTDAHVWYRVTRTSCTCKGHAATGICKHRVLACYMADRGQAPFRGKVAPTVTVIVGETIPGPVQQARRDSEPSIHEMRTGRRAPRNSADVERLQWSAWS